MFYKKILILPMLAVAVFGISTTGASWAATCKANVVSYTGGHDPQDDEFLYASKADYDNAVKASQTKDKNSGKVKVYQCVNGSKFFGYNKSDCDLDDTIDMPANHVFEGKVVSTAKSYKCNTGANNKFVAYEKKKSAALICVEGQKADCKNAFWPGAKIGGEECVYRMVNGNCNIVAISCWKDFDCIDKGTDGHKNCDCQAKKKNSTTCEENKTVECTDVQKKSGATSCVLKKFGAAGCDPVIVGCDTTKYELFVFNKDERKNACQLKNKKEDPATKSCREKRAGWNQVALACCDTGNDAKYEGNATTGTCTCTDSSKEFRIYNEHGYCVDKGAQPIGPEPLNPVINPEPTETCDCATIRSVYDKYTNMLADASTKQCAETFAAMAKLLADACPTAQGACKTDVRNIAASLEQSLKNCANVSVVPAEPVIDEKAVADAVEAIDKFKATLDVSVWKDAEGNFNTARLVSDGAAAVVLGTAGGLITSSVVKKNQLKKGFEDIVCTVGGQVVGSYGDEVTVGVR